ncbi:hypothetical protein L1O48_08355 [Ligilactobacillus equi]|uniref:hypothetical protein n=1 Tax=Ligilactobacillus equi TaxID=137357 RepID=UPI002ED052B2
MKFKKISLLILPVLALSLALGACSSDKTQDQTQSSVTSTTSKVATTAKSSNSSQAVENTSASVTSSSSVQATSSSSSQVASESASATSTSQVTGIMQYAPQALAKVAKENDLDSSELYVTADGDILSVHENHAKMIENGKDVDPSVDPVIAAYTVSNGQLVSAY